MVFSSLLHQRIHTGDDDSTIGYHSQSSCSLVRISHVLFCRFTVERAASSRQFSFTRFHQPKLKSTKRGFTCLKIPGKDLDFDLTAFMDVETNPGPSEIKNSRSFQTLHPPSPRCFRLHRRETIISLRRYTTSNLSQNLLLTLKNLDILRCRGVRAGKQSPNRKRQVHQKLCYHHFEGTK